jgi:ATP-dependent exoDNAse (exonuclease V) beta subunit
MKVRIVTASAGSGKTTRLSEILRDELVAGRASPEGIIATTFTKQAAAELIERARSKLLEKGRGREAHALLAARIGTVNSVCGSLVADYAFELGLSPRLAVLDEAAAEAALKHALAAVADDETAAELQDFRSLFDANLDWHFEVRRLIEAARANGIDSAELRASAERSVETLEGCLGPAGADGGAIDQALSAALAGALAAIDPSSDRTKGTAKYVALLDDCRQALAEGRLRWGHWAKLVTERPTKASAAHAEAVAAAAAEHARHPRLFANMQRMIALVFDAAARAMDAYQAHKRELGVIDFVDQETFALELLRSADVRADLAGRIDLVLVDEFQDTSPLQLAIFLALAELARESVWVGDPKQAIFGFRGTDPALMDAAIESLTSPAHDSELIDRAVDAVARAGTLETLGVSYRSRPELVHLTSDIFARPFAAQGMPEERVRLRPASEDEPAGLGPVVEHWPFQVAGRGGKEAFAACAAARVRALLASAPEVRDRGSDPGGATRPAGAGDVAVLCRTNDQCRAVADALAAQGIPAVVPRVGLLNTPEGRLALAGLWLWVDPRDALAAATIARLTTFAGDPDALLARAVVEPGRAAFAGEPAVERILAARKAAPDLGAVAALSAIVDAAGLRELCAGWGGAEQRLANLDALRAHAARYTADSEATGGTPAVIGLLGHLRELTADYGIGVRRSDSQALLGGEDSVTVSTWHRAKGLEWPLVVLFGLEDLREPLAYGVHVMSDRRDLDVADPLAGRWIRFWPNPYSMWNQRGPVRDAYESGAVFQALRERAEREALRVLYVGWTRARDRLILAAKAGKLTAGLLGTLARGDAAWIADPGIVADGDHGVTWAGRRVRLRVRPAAPAEPAPAAAAPGRVTVGLAPREHPPARLLPSAAPPIACTVGAPVALGPRIAISGAPAMDRVGDAVHAFLAADLGAPGERGEDERVALARALLERYGLAAHLVAEDVAGAAANLRRWLADEIGATRVHREWPIAERLATGTLVLGTADLVARTPAGLVLVDHKTFPGALEAAVERVPRYAGQLAAYARAVAAGTGERVASAWIHLPVLGAVAEVRPEA